MNALSHLDKVLALFLAVIPKAVVHPKAQQLQRWLGAEKVMGWHVEVIQETKQALPTCWDEHAFGSLLYSALHYGLDVIRGGLVETEKNKEKVVFYWEPYECFFRCKNPLKHH